MIKFEIEPTIGTVIRLDDQEFEMIGDEPYQRSDGKPSRVLVWQTACPVCEVGFEVRSSAGSATFTRRCETHRRTGKPVKGKRGRKVVVSASEA